jgi:ubiquitin C-terminal hydrolase
MDASYFVKKGLCGLENCGNTCYINTITQCINNDREFIKYFLTDDYKQDANNSIKYPLKEFIEITRKLYKENTYITPHDYLIKIKSLACKDSCYRELIGSGQADSQEFLQFFLEKIHEQLKYNIDCTISGESENETDTIAVQAYNAWNVYFTKNGYSKVIEHFYGQEYSNITSSTDLTYSSKTFSPFSSISVEIPSEFGTQSCALYDCLDNYTSKELNITHTQHNGAVQNKYDKQLYFWSLPKTLIIIIKRYDNHLRKKKNLVSFPINDLNLLSYSIGYNNDKNVYDLFAISNHSGDMSGGHYWCYAKNADNSWYNFNDRSVSSIPESELITPNAYCLFYKKKNL